MLYELKVPASISSKCKPEELATKLLHSLDSTGATNVLTRHIRREIITCLAPVAELSVLKIQKELPSLIGKIDCINQRPATMGEVETEFDIEMNDGINVMYVIADIAKRLHLAVHQLRFDCSSAIYELRIIFQANNDAYRRVTENRIRNELINMGAKGLLWTEGYYIHFPGEPETPQIIDVSHS
jgi:hypothetical protein